MTVLEVITGFIAATLLYREVKAILTVRACSKTADEFIAALEASRRSYPESQPHQ
jgi:hypothetical protein